MKRHSLQEVAKFAAGVVTADIITHIWLWQENLLPQTFWGITYTADMVIPTLVFDIALIIILVHYGWHIGKIPTMKERTYLVVAGAAFALIAVAHLARVFFNAEITIMDWNAPLWLSWIGVLITTYLAYSSFHFAGKIR